MTRPWILFAGSTICLLAPARAGAQGVQGFIGASAGASTDERGVRSAAYALTPALILTSAPTTLFIINATGTSFGDGRWNAGAGLGLSAHSSLASRGGLGLDAGATGSLSSYGTRLGFVEASPVAELRLGRVRLFAGARGALAGSISRVPLPGAPTTSQSRGTIGPLFGAEFATATVRLGYREQREPVAGSTATDRTLSAEQNLGLVQWGGAAGIRTLDGQSAMFGSAHLRVPLTAGLALSALASWYPANRLLGTAGGRVIRGGIELGFGGRSAGTTPSPRIAGAPVLLPGATRLRIEAAGARSVEIAGDWNHWHAEPAARAAHGVWYADVTLAPGSYRYAFKVDGKWKVPNGVPTADDGFGGKSAIVHINSSTGE